jgi:hypothetical protein
MCTSTAPSEPPARAGPVVTVAVNRDSDDQPSAPVVIRRTPHVSDSDRTESARVTVTVTPGRHDPSDATAMPVCQ